MLLWRPVQKPVSFPTLQMFRTQFVVCLPLHRGHIFDVYFFTPFKVSLGGEGGNTGVEDEIEGAMLQTKHVALPGQITLLCRSESKCVSLDCEHRF